LIRPPPTGPLAGGPVATVTREGVEVPRRHLAGSSDITACDHQRVDVEEDHGSTHRARVRAREIRFSHGGR
jgi:hypothetical protein